MTSMIEDLLDRSAVDRNLDRLARSRMKGRKLFGVKFDPVAKRWTAFLGNQVVIIGKRSVAVPETARTAPTRSSARKKK